MAADLTFLVNLRGMDPNVRVFLGRLKEGLYRILPPSLI